MTEQEFWQALNNMPEPQPVFYRLYYDDRGRPLFYSMEDLPGTYIEITHEQYQRRSSHVRVREGCLVDLAWRETEKIVPAESGTPCHPKDVAVVVESTPNIAWSKQIYETN